MLFSFYSIAILNYTFFSPFCLASAIGPVLELLGTTDLELRILSTAIAANVLSFSDSLLLTNEACINDFSDSMEDLLDAAKRYSLFCLYALSCSL